MVNSSNNNNHNHNGDDDYDHDEDDDGCFPGKTEVVLLIYPN